MKTSSGLLCSFHRKGVTFMTQPKFINFEQGEPVAANLL